jgi:hypothetical protein
VRIAVLAVALAIAPSTYAAATITIVNADTAGVGFNDQTPVAPAGGNTGTTLGQQRMNVFLRAAQIWGAVLNSNVPILIQASWPNLPCNANSAVLGSASATSVHANFPGAIVTGVWYSQALANKLAGADLIANPDVVAQFNPRLGQPDCLAGLPFYLGLDGNPPGNTVHFLPTVLHEFGHGLGFQTFSNGSTGAFLGGRPSIADVFLLDRITNEYWANTSAAARRQSAVNGQGRLVWDGPNVKAAVPTVLSRAGEVQVTAPAGVSTTYYAGPSAMGPPLLSGVSGEVMPVISAAGGGNACSPLTGFDAAAVNGRIALVDRGGCALDTKVLNAQFAGARAVIFVNNAADVPAPNLTVYNSAVTIPNVLINPTDGSELKNLLQFRSRFSSGVFITLRQSDTLWAGADEASRLIMYAPATFAGGSSVSHVDISAFRNQLMEPFSNVDLTLSLLPPQDLTLRWLLDIGW